MDNNPIIPVCFGVSRKVVEGKQAKISDTLKQAISNPINTSPSVDRFIAKIFYFVSIHSIKN